MRPPRRELARVSFVGEEEITVKSLAVIVSLVLCCFIVSLYFVFLRFLPVKIVIVCLCTITCLKLLFSLGN